MDRPILTLSILPTHSLKVQDGIEIDSQNEHTKLLPSGNNFSFMGKKENFARALWEV
jgi:hypothetical protein